MTNFMNRVQSLKQKLDKRRVKHGFEQVMKDSRHHQSHAQLNVTNRLTSVDREIASYKLDGAHLLVNRINKQLRKVFNQLKMFSYVDEGYQRKKQRDSSLSQIKQKTTQRRRSFVRKPKNNEAETSLEKSRKNL